jgi:hypothetical protein
MSQAAIVKDDDVVMGDPEDESSDAKMNDADCGEDMELPDVCRIHALSACCFCPCQLTKLTERKPYKDLLCNYWLTIMC